MKDIPRTGCFDSPSIAVDSDPAANIRDLRLMAAPIQGLTEAAWRSVHFRMFGCFQGDVEYFTPFVRVEKGEVRKRDLHDFTSELNAGIPLTPQIIFRDVDEWHLLVDTLAEAGASRIDMNLGCPFVPQIRKGRGAGLIGNADVMSRIADAMLSYAGSVEFSVKMRLGVSEPSEAWGLVDILNVMPLRHIAVHPRTAKQQYRGELLIEEMHEFTSRLRHPVVFNGEISTPRDILELKSVYSGVMAGRGLLARPSLFAEYISGEEWDAHRREEAFLSLLSSTSAILAERLCGHTQLSDKMKAYWEYVPAGLDKKLVKQGKKKGNVFSLQ
ncbi:MAG: tRNA-dihydrouridine synthase family protein [Muribaculaceae bacterium]|nr:tRNA-dihydrouridine synthase family protein [Muribaculaceae bacterium]